MANVMKKAWDIARNGQKKFGGKVKEYFSEALKLAWALLRKGVNEMTIELKGSEKQVKWATDLVNQAKHVIEVHSKDVEKYINENYADAPHHALYLTALSFIDGKINKVFEQDSSSYYIELLKYKNTNEIIETLTNTIEQELVENKATNPKWSLMVLRMYRGVARDKALGLI